MSDPLDLPQDILFKILNFTDNIQSITNFSICCKYFTENFKVDELINNKINNTLSQQSVGDFQESSYLDNLYYSLLKGTHYSITIEHLDNLINYENDTEKDIAIQKFYDTYKDKGNDALVDNIVFFVTNITDKQKKSFGHYKRLLKNSSIFQSLNDIYKNINENKDKIKDDKILSYAMYYNHWYILNKILNKTEESLKQYLSIPSPFIHLMPSRPLLDNAVYCGHINILDFLLSKNITFPSVSIEAFKHAIVEKKLKIVKYLFENEIIDKDVIEKNFLEIVNVALKHFDQELFDFLLLRCQGSRVQILHLFLKNTDNNDPETFKKLLNATDLYKGFDITQMIDDKGNNLLHTLVTRRCFSQHRFTSDNRIREIFKYIVDLYKDKNRDINAKNKQGLTPLLAVFFSDCYLERGLYNSIQHMYFLCKHVEIIQYLLDGGADINAVTKDEKNVLHLVSQVGHRPIMQFLLNYQDKIISINDQDNQGNTPLHSAVTNQHEDLVRLLIEKDSNANRANFEGKVPLDLAIFLNNAELVGLLWNQTDIKCRKKHLSELLKEGSSIENKEIIIEAILKHGNQEFELHSLIEKNDVAAIKLLLKYGANIFIKNAKGFNPLELAQGNQEIIDILLNTPDKKGDMVLHRSAKSGDINAIARLMLHGVDINQGNIKDGFTILHYAAQLKNDNLINNVLDAYSSLISVNSKCKLYNKTPLHYAIENDSLHGVKCLLVSGADIFIKSENDNDSLNYAYKKQPILNILLETVDSEGNTPLHNSIQKKDLERIKSLLEYGADIFIKNKKELDSLAFAFDQKDQEIVDILLNTKSSGYVPLYWAIKVRGDVLMKRLLSCGADIFKINSKGLDSLDIVGSDVYILDILLTTADINGDTIFHRAAKNGNIDTIKRLLGYGVDINQVNEKNGCTILHYAAQLKDSSCVDYLLNSYSAKTSILVQIFDNHGKTPFYYAKENNHKNALKCLILGDREEQIVQEQEAKKMADEQEQKQKQEKLRQLEKEQEAKEEELRQKQKEEQVVKDQLEEKKKQEQKAAEQLEQLGEQGQRAADRLEELRKLEQKAVELVEKLRLEQEKLEQEQKAKEAANQLEQEEELRLEQEKKAKQLAEKLKQIKEVRQKLEQEAAKFAEQLRQEREKLEQEAVELVEQLKKQEEELRHKQEEELRQKQEEELRLEQEKKAKEAVNQLKQEEELRQKQEKKLRLEQEQKAKQLAEKLKQLRKVRQLKQLQEAKKIADQQAQETNRSSAQASNNGSGKNANYFPSIFFSAGKEVATLFSGIINFFWHIFS